MDRLECFNIAAAHVLQSLLEVFPEPVVLDSQVMIARLAEAYPDCSISAGPSSPGQNLVSWTVRFLIDEGFIRSAISADGRVFVRCTLTAKGLGALNRSFEALQSKPTIGRRILEAGKVIGPEMAGAIISRLVGS